MDWLGRVAAKREFEAFVKETTNDLVRTAYLLTLDPAKAEDLVQEAYLQVAKRWDRVGAMEYPAAYTRRTLVNLALGGSKKRQRQREELGDSEEIGRALDPSAARALAAVEDIAVFRAALVELPERQRAVLVLRYWMGLPEVEVAAALECSVGTVKSTASRAARRMARKMSEARACEGPPPAPDAARPAGAGPLTSTERAIT